MNDPAEVVLEIRGLSKNFPGVKALQDVDLVVRRGEVHALMGENGAGKSTLIKALTGVYPRDAGSIRLNGVEINPHSPKAAEALGVSTVYQEVNLIPHRSVAENICLGRQPTRFGMIRWWAVARRAEAALARVDLKLDVSQPLSACSIAVQQLIAIVGLRQEVDGPPLHGRHRFLHTGAAAQENDRKGFIGRGEQPLNLEAADTGQLKVQHHTSCRTRRRRGKEVRRGAIGADRVSGCVQKPRRRVPRGSVVFDDVNDGSGSFG